MTRSIETRVRCFRRLRDAPTGHEQSRRGIWLMADSEGGRGVFFHGDREETQPPRYTTLELEEMNGLQGQEWFHVAEITPEEALYELNSWPAGQDHAMKVFEMYPIKE